MQTVLVINPASDAAFTADAHAQLEAGADTPARLQAALRTAYPRAVVRARELSSEANAVWYVYREGSWIPSSGADDR
jgi:hypothetical protein